MQRLVPRDRFDAAVTCEQARDKGTGTATGLFAAGTVRVGYAHADVSVVRKQGEGIRVKVESVAREVEIVGVGTIGVVRTEATSAATGRRGKAGGTFTRTICDVHLPGRTDDRCYRDQKPPWFDDLNKALTDRFKGEAKLRSPDAGRMKGSASGYRAGVERERKERFADFVISKDTSQAVPGLELVFQQGDGGVTGVGRQIVQLAGVGADTSYGIACLYGQLGAGGCATEPGTYIPPEPPSATTGEPVVVTETVVEHAPADPAAALASHERPRRESRIVRVLKAPFRAAAAALRLLFNSPRELGLMLAVWALLYAPCYLTERRRSIAGLRADRAGFQGAA